MEALRIRTHLDSDTVYLPQLGRLVGKDVEIIILEDSKDVKKKVALDEFLSLGGSLDLDWDAIEHCRTESMI